MSKENQKSLRKQIIPYEKSNLKASIWQMINTFIPFIFLWYLAYKSISISVVLTIFIDIVAALFLIRIFIIFHDCCHQSFFKNKTANKVLGTITGVVTLFPFSQWKHSHSIHHATSGNLDKRGIGDMWVLTVEEYVAASSWTKIQYRLYRNPLIMFGLGPIYIVLISNRFNTKDAKLKERLNTYLTNILIVGVSALFCYTIGWENYLLVEGPIFFISAVLGIWLFYVQHQFEDTYFEEDTNWEYVKAAVEGSSFYKLPKLLQWITGNIGYHHVHHLSPRVPNYNLESVHNNTLPLQNVPTITLKTSLTSLKFKLWDEETKQFVGFKDIKSIYKVNRESSDTV
ncbi:MULTISPECIES: fatty acid desaturase [Bacillaceae]|uniref:Fatty acid desaturase n=1 Tax=Gottfriedia luciferensis TaxID=178774 RepID=A0ABX2ZVU4_9BACI|nr:MULTISPECIES: fatty acid desaturase [Bacillaceae]ODG93916.1 fatty acid desaturase [Gottfriedia luciferensis]PGZ88235.1 fatty acid desaturase [Bacillus sp. AFS029533]SFC32148.1 omega-6 fatty acid desaturase (delta-12 desaturase) [Bacillus sp. UNCCL81]